MNAKVDDVYIRTHRMLAALQLAKHNVTANAYAPYITDTDMGLSSLVDWVRDV